MVGSQTWLGLGPETSPEVPLEGAERPEVRCETRYPWGPASRAPRLRGVALPAPLAPAPDLPG